MLTDSNGDLLICSASNMAHSQLLKAIKSDIEGIPLLAKSLDRVRHDANESQRAKEGEHRLSIASS